MIFVIPTTGTTSNYSQTTTLDGVSFGLRFLWNDRDRHWYLTLRDAEGNDLVSGVKLVADLPFAAHDTVEGLPAGRLWTIDLTGHGADPTLRELGSRMRLFYVDAEHAL